METTLPALPLEVREDGTLVAYGMPLGSEPLFPADVLAQLQAANVQHLSVDLDGQSLVLAVNGEVLPIIGWSDLNMIVNNVVQPMVNLSPELMSGGVGILLNILNRGPLDLDIARPATGGAEPVAVPEQVDTTMRTPDLEQFSPPIIHLNATFSNGELQSLSNLSAEQLSQAGISLPDLPPNLLQLFNDLDASTVQLKTMPNQLAVNVDGETLLSLTYDEPSLQRLLNLLNPFLGDTPLQNPAVAQLLQEQILPLAPGADIDVTLNLQ
jgi:hypothetical protein